MIHTDIQGQKHTFFPLFLGYFGIDESLSRPEAASSSASSAPAAIWETLFLRFSWEDGLLCNRDDLGALKARLINTLHAPFPLWQDQLTLRPGWAICCWRNKRHVCVIIRLHTLRSSSPVFWNSLNRCWRLKHCMFLQTTVEWWHEEEC